MNKTHLFTRYKRFALLFGLILIGLSSCIEIEEQIVFENDGGGRYELTHHVEKLIKVLDELTTSDNKADLLAQNDSLFMHFSMQLEGMEGIQNVQFEKGDDSEYYRIHFDFDNVKNLQRALRIIDVDNKGKSGSVSLSDRSFTRKGLRSFSLAWLSHYTGYPLDQNVIDGMHKEEVLRDFFDSASVKLTYSFPKNINKIEKGTGDLITESELSKYTETLFPIQKSVPRKSEIKLRFGE